MQKSVVLLIIGIVLIIVAFIKGYSIPFEANKDFNRRKPLDWNAKESEYIYVQGSEHRRLLQNFYLGASGLICLFVGLATCKNNNVKNVLSYPEKSQNGHKSTEQLNL